MRTRTALGWHAATGGARPGIQARCADPPHGRAVRGARRDDGRHAPPRAAVRSNQRDRAVRDAPRRGGVPVGPSRRPVRPTGAHRGHRRHRAAPAPVRCSRTTIGSSPTRPSYDVSSRTGAPDESVAVRGPGRHCPVRRPGRLPGRLGSSRADHGYETIRVAQPVEDPRRARRVPRFVLQRQAVTGTEAALGLLLALAIALVVGAVLSSSRSRRRRSPCSP